MGASERKHRNRLADSTSPYLLQHAGNPVDWYPWGDQALARAREEDKPILLSIGYSACHWCHVMAHESFEDETIGAQMSRDFVCIKVDREERPDIDDIYMAATLTMNHGQGGWPMTVFLTPEQEPFFAGTYFPPEDRWGRPGFRTLLTRIAESWREDRDALRQQGSRIVELLAQNARAAPSLSVGESEIRAAVSQLERAFDPRWGGFGQAPKFPPSTGISLLLRAHRRFGSERALAMSRRTLDAMAHGGMYDHLAGGFHRYSVDERWLVPHFEKMLYDNALLAKAYLAGSAAAEEPFYARIAGEILDYVLREMTDPGGGFYSATDADSEGVEGRFFVWTPEQVHAELDDEAARHFCAWYDVSERGNWEGNSILNTPRSEPEVAEELGLSVDELRRSVSQSRSALYEVRKGRVPPGLDDKVLTAWNGLMIGAMAEGSRVLGVPRYRAAAERAADFALGTLRRSDGRLLRTWREGRAHLDAYLEDYAYLAEGLVDLYEAGASESYLAAALELVEQLLSEFQAPDGGFYSVSGDHERLVVRHREGHDGATPNANAVAAHALARLSFHYARDDLREQSARAIRAYGKAIAQQPRAFSRSLEVVDLLLEGPVELAFLGASDSPELAALRREAARHYLPNRIVAHGEPDSAPLPLLEGKTLVDGRPALYVCRDFACRRPVTEPGDVAAVLDADRRAVEPATALMPRRLAGFATAEGTARFAERHRTRLPHGYGPLGSTGLTASRLGFGGYRVDDETGEHRDALVEALRTGVNLIDTSSNYAHGASERLVGEVLGDLARSGGPGRDELIVVSKIGYIQGPNLERARERAEPFPEVVRYDDQLWHCIHPEFLSDQLERSLERLRLEALDVLLIHNPEYFLTEAARRGDEPLEERRAEYYRRLGEAFRWLETQVDAGRIRRYGVSSNTSPAAASAPEATSLDRLLAAAREAGGEQHRLAVLQLPFNLLERDAGLEHNSGPDLSMTVLERARRSGIAVLVNRPLNAMSGAGVVRLSDFQVGDPGIDLDGQLARLRELEQEYREKVAGEFETAQGSPAPKDFFRWGEELAALAPRLGGHPHWKQIEAGHVMPQLTQLVGALDRSLGGTAQAPWRSFKEQYLPALSATLDELGRRARERSVRDTAALRAALAESLPAERRGEALSRQALWLLASTPGVSSVLVGMREPRYVGDAIAVLAWPPLDDALSLLEALRGT